MSPTNPTHAQKKAAELLRSANVTRVPVPVEELAQRIGATIHLEPFTGELYGMVHRNQDGTAVIGVNSLDAPTRRRFTIAHEIGHLVLHADEALHIDERSPIGLRNEKSSWGNDPREIQANQFAAALLMPLEQLLRDVAMVKGNDIEQAVDFLARKYEVSPQAMSFRLGSLNILR
jgi:Zn-dependent peptidase ImmA (M78 family)